MNQPKDIHLSLRTADPRRKIHLMWIPTRNLSAEMASPRSSEGPNFVNTTSLEAISWQELLTYFVYQEEPQPELSASHSAPRLFMYLSQPLQGCPYFIFLPMNWDLPRPVRTIQIVFSFAFIPTNQNSTIWIPHLHKTDLTGNLGGNFDYKIIEIIEPPSER